MLRRRFGFLSMYRRILLAYDGWVLGKCSLHEGARLAQPSGARVCLLAVMHLTTGIVAAEGAHPGVNSEQMRTCQNILLEGAARLRRMGLEPESATEHRPSWPENLRSGSRILRRSDRCWASPPRYSDTLLVGFSCRLPAVSNAASWWGVQCRTHCRMIEPRTSDSTRHLPGEAEAVDGAMKSDCRQRHFGSR